MKQVSDRLKLRVLATTDIHGFYTNFDYYKDQVVDRLGLISLANMIEDARSENCNTLLFDNGDLLQGSPMSDYLRDYAVANGHPAYSLMNAIGYDAATLGNHEFNFGVPYLLEVIAQADFPYVNANIETEDGIPFLPPSIILKRVFKSEGGVEVALNIGVTGILPPQIMTWDKTHLDEYAIANDRLITHDAYSAVKREAAKLKASGADLVVVLAHTGLSKRSFEEEMENSGYYIAQIEDVDLLITGHQHRRFPSESYRELSELGFDVDAGTICGTPTVMPGSWAKWLGVIDLELVKIDDKWHFEGGKGSLRGVDHYLAPGRSINSRYWQSIESAHEMIRETMNVPVGYTDSGFYSYLSLIQDDNCIQIVADAQKYAAEKLLADLPYSEGLPLLSAVPLFKVGSRKDDPTYFTEIAPGKLSFKDIADLYVYPNYLVVLEISGENLKEWLECCASIYHQILPVDEAQHLINWAKYRPYNFDVIKGITYQIDPTTPPRYAPDLTIMNHHSERIMNLAYQGKPILPEDRFYLATNSYRALVDRFPGAGKGNMICSTMKEIPEVILAYVMEKGAEMLSLNPDRNWGLDRSALQGRKLLIESANSSVSESIILETAQYPIVKVGEDPEKFALYQLDFS